jgi:hypothetical protein
MKRTLSSRGLEARKRLEKALKNKLISFKKQEEFTTNSNGPVSEPLPEIT